ncbi:hypothetical protein ElyMa_004181700 [Elysia marginata]|uniref:Uncharacterized protein n=1 Tax=Elysia marginata TaxID=1093978 RepID=A0AAV4GL25_9GAST|nr:hypothetical protein ElyMa_004181700 [Elysia marginata]
MKMMTSEEYGLWCYLHDDSDGGDGDDDGGDDDGGDDDNSDCRKLLAIVVWQAHISRENPDRHLGENPCLRVLTVTGHHLTGLSEGQRKVQLCVLSSDLLRHREIDR